MGPFATCRQSASEAQRQHVKGSGCRLGRSVESIRQLESVYVPECSFEGSLDCFLGW